MRLSIIIVLLASTLFAKYIDLGTVRGKFCSMQPSCAEFSSNIPEHLPIVSRIQKSCKEEEYIPFELFVQLLNSYYEKYGPTIYFERLARAFLLENDKRRIIAKLILGHYFKLASYFLRNYDDFDLNAPIFRKKRRLLHAATTTGDEKAVAYLLANGADPHFVDDYNLTPLFYIDAQAVAKVYKKYHYTPPKFTNCSILIDEERIQKAIPYCKEKAKVSEKHDYLVGASWYYLLAKEPLKSKTFSQQLIDYTQDALVGYVNLGHYYLLVHDYTNAQRYYRIFVEKMDDKKEAQKVLLEDFTILRKIYKKEFDIYKAFEIREAIFYAEDRLKAELEKVLP